jgi:hypothetical protein
MRAGRRFHTGRNAYSTRQAKAPVPPGSKSGRSRQGVETAGRARIQRGRVPAPQRNESRRQCGRAAGSTQAGMPILLTGGSPNGARVRESRGSRQGICLTQSTGSTGDGVSWIIAGAPLADAIAARYGRGSTTGGSACPTKIEKPQVSATSAESAALRGKRQLCSNAPFGREMV